MRRTKILIATVSAGTALLLQPQPAGAFWRAVGAGTGAASTGTSGSIVVAPGTPTQPLFPLTGARGDVATRLTNPTTSPIAIARLQLDTTKGTGGFAVDTAHSTCTVASLSYTTQTNGGAGWTVPASGTLTVDLTSAIALATTAPNACQGASFTVYLTS
jgi:hypothetical protein